MDWRDAVVEAVHRYTVRNRTKVITRQGLISQELPEIVRVTSAGGTTPEQTLSRILQELRDEKLLYFTSRGTYVLLDAPVEVEADDLPEDAIDFAIEAGKLQLGDVKTSDDKRMTRLRRGQERVRELTLKYYRDQCGFCDVSDRRLLVAGHIARWADEPAARGNLSNVMCMCSFHDTLFENGYFALADDYRILKKPDIPSRTIRQILEITQAFRTGTPHPPAAAFLHTHRLRTGFES